MWKRFFLLYVKLFVDVIWKPLHHKDFLLSFCCCSDRSDKRLTGYQSVLWRRKRTRSIWEKRVDRGDCLPGRRSLMTFTIFSKWRPHYDHRCLNILHIDLACLLPRGKKTINHLINEFLTNCQKKIAIPQHPPHDQKVYGIMDDAFVMEAILHDLLLLMFNETALHLAVKHQQEDVVLVSFWY